MEEKQEKITKYFHAPLTNIVEEREKNMQSKIIFLMILFVVCAGCSTSNTNQIENSQYPNDRIEPIDDGNLTSIETDLEGIKKIQEYLDIQKKLDETNQKIAELEKKMQIDKKDYLNQKKLLKEAYEKRKQYQNQYETLRESLNEANLKKHLLMTSASLLEIGLRDLTLEEVKLRLKNVREGDEILPFIEAIENYMEEYVKKNTYKETNRIFAVFQNKYSSRDEKLEILLKMSQTMTQLKEQAKKVDVYFGYRPWRETKNEMTSDAIQTLQNTFIDIDENIESVSRAFWNRDKKKLRQLLAYFSINEILFISCDFAPHMSSSPYSDFFERLEYYKDIDESFWKKEGNGLTLYLDTLLCILEIIDKQALDPDTVLLWFANKKSLQVQQKNLNDLGVRIIN